MAVDLFRPIKPLLRVLTPDIAQQAYRMARWRISAHGPMLGADGWNRFKALAVEQKARGANEYTNFLRRADPSLDLPELIDARFVGEGWGDWNLNLYRAGESNGKPVFEKVYFSGSDALKKTLWFHDVVLPQFGQTFSTPPIVQTRKGEVLTVLYFPLVDLGDPVPSEDMLTIAVALKRAVSSIRWEGDDPDIDDFRRNSFYREHQKEFLRILTRNGRDLIQVSVVEEWMQRPEMPRRFSHGDLSPDNVLSCGTLLDFDHCGFYPAGYDCGATLRYSQTPASVEDLLNLVDRQLAPDCTSTQLGVMFFLAVFGSIGVAQKTSTHLDESFLLDLWDCILRRFDEQTRISV